MSGDWMKVELDMPDKPEVQRIAGMLSIDSDAVVGKLIRVWAWFDKHTENGHAHGVTYSLLDRITCHAGFAEAMALVGWLHQDGHDLALPNFERHNGKTAKNRALSGKRQQARRKNVTQNVPEESRSERDKSVTREEKRREDKQPPISPDGGQAFAEFYAAYPNKVAKPAALKAWNKIKPDELTIALIRSALEVAKVSDAWLRDKGQFIPHPATWLNQRRWEDKPVVTSERPSWLPENRNPDGSLRVVC